MSKSFCRSWALVWFPSKRIHFQLTSPNFSKEVRKLAIINIWQPSSTYGSHLYGERRCCLEIICVTQTKSWHYRGTVADRVCSGRTSTRRMWENIASLFWASSQWTPTINQFHGSQLPYLPTHLISRHKASYCAPEWNFFWGAAASAIQRLSSQLRRMHWRRMAGLGYHQYSSSLLNVGGDA